MNYRELGAKAAENKHVCNLLALVQATRSKQHIRDVFIGYELAHTSMVELSEISIALEAILPFLGLNDLYLISQPGEKAIRCKSVFEICQRTRLDHNNIVLAIEGRCAVSNNSGTWHVSALQSVL